MRRSIIIREYKITFRLDSVTKLKEDFYINNVKLYNSNRNLYAKTIISATGSESAKNLAHKQMDNVCSSICFVSGQIVYYHIESVKDLKVDPPLFSSVTETLSEVTINKIIANTDMDEAVKIAMLMGQFLELENVMFLMNHSDFRTWITLYKIYEIIDHDAGIKKQGWLTHRQRNLFKRSANNTEASSVHESRHGIQKGKSPRHPMKINEAVNLINKLTHHWIHFLDKKQDQGQDMSSKGGTSEESPIIDEGNQELT